MGFTKRGKRVADKRRGDAMALKECLLKGEDTEKTIDSGAHGTNPSFSPSPGLRGDEVDHRHVLAPEALGESQMKIRGIGEDGEFRALHRDRANELAELAPDPGDVADDFHQADHGDGSHIDDRPNADSLHAGSGAPKELGLGMPGAQGFDNPRRIQVARSLPSRDQDPHSFLAILAPLRALSVE